MTPNKSQRKVRCDTCLRRFTDRGLGAHYARSPACRPNSGRATAERPVPSSLRPKASKSSSQSPRKRQRDSPISKESQGNTNPYNIISSMTPPARRTPRKRRQSAFERARGALDATSVALTKAAVCDVNRVNFTGAGEIINLQGSHRKDSEDDDAFGLKLCQQSGRFSKKHPLCPSPPSQPICSKSRQECRSELLGSIQRRFNTISNTLKSKNTTDVPHLPHPVQKSTLPMSAPTLNPIPSHLFNTLFPFQLNGVASVVEQFDGCALLADDMGLGKTLEALSIAAVYRDEWPLLIVCPASVRLTWAKQVERWYHFLNPVQDIQVFRSHADQIMPGVRVCIVSYRMLVACLPEIIRVVWRFVIIDESQV